MLQNRILTSLSDSDRHTSCDGNDKLLTPREFQVWHCHSAMRPTEPAVDDAAALRLCDLKIILCVFRNKLNILFSGGIRLGWHFGAAVASKLVGHKFNLLCGVSMFSLRLFSSFLQQYKNKHVKQYYSGNLSTEWIQFASRILFTLHLVKDMKRWKPLSGHKK